MDPERELLWLRRVRDVSVRMLDEQDPAKLLPHIVDAAIEITEAERGFLVVVTGFKPGGGYRIKIKAARGFDRAALRADKNHVSRTVVERVLERAGGLVTTSEGDADVLDVSSVQARRVLSIICVPLRLRGEVRGVLYLDHRFEKGAFTEGDLTILQTFADQAALAIETASLRAGEGEAKALRASLDELEHLQDVAHLPRTAKPAPQRLRFGELVGASPPMAELYADIERVARTWDPVLILGKSGTGKELVAREIHRRGAHADEPFLSENCSAFAEAPLESELFGHVKGSFTGASTDREGLFREAGRGTLFLDEVGEMSPALQVKLLRVLQEGRVRPVGGDRTLPIECRVLAATHRNLRKLVESGTFREDLYYRLDVIRVTLPALRHREGDVPLLLQHFAEKAGSERLDLSPKALELLCRYAWPGNVRELENETRRLATLGQTRITAQHLSQEIRDGRGTKTSTGSTSGKTLAEVERDMVVAALKECANNKSQTARQLGIPRSTLYNLIEKYGLG